ncbi:hypothetical protein BGW80DRAFT_1442446 [Lactifluus volemus]|nr:hypothetical protein BGW80DRAFT_1442446 [Lactifluus volemus]
MGATNPAKNKYTRSKSIIGRSGWNITGTGMGSVYFVPSEITPGVYRASGYGDLSPIAIPSIGSGSSHEATPTTAASLITWFNGSPGGAELRNSNILDPLLRETGRILTRTRLLDNLLNDPTVTSKTTACLYHRFAAADDWLRTSRPDLEKVINEGVHTVIYDGDADFILNFDCVRPRGVTKNRHLSSFRTFKSLDILAKSWEIADLAVFACTIDDPPKIPGSQSVIITCNGSHHWEKKERMPRTTI